MHETRYSRKREIAESFVREFVNFDLCVNMKHDDIARIYNLQVSFALFILRYPENMPKICAENKLSLWFEWYGKIRKVVSQIAN